MNSAQVLKTIAKHEKIMKAQGLPKHAIVAVIEPAEMTGSVEKFKEPLAKAIGERGIEMVEAARAFYANGRHVTTQIAVEQYVSAAREVIEEKFVFDMKNSYEDALAYSKEHKDDIEISEIFRAKNTETEEGPRGPGMLN